MMCFKTSYYFKILLATKKPLGFAARSHRHKTKMLSYNASDKQAFKSYFVKPEPAKRKRGRPKKKKRKKKTVQAKQLQTRLQTKDGNVRSIRQLDAQLVSVVQHGLRTKCTRINWDVEPHRSLRARLVESWTTKSDLYTPGDSFQRFCTKNAIHRQVLGRYLKKVANGTKPKKRGRKTFLSHDVMVHLCEGLFFLFRIPTCFHQYIFLPLSFLLLIARSCEATR